jgi:hypothetical protein
MVSRLSGRQVYSAGVAGAWPRVRQRLAQPGLKRMPESLSNQI